MYEASSSGVSGAQDSTEGSGQEQNGNRRQPSPECEPSSSCPANQHSLNSAQAGLRDSPEGSGTDVAANHAHREMHSNSTDGENAQWNNRPPANAAQAGADEEVHLVIDDERERMLDDGYPIVAADMEPSERERELERQRGIDRVIDQQAFNQDVIEALAQMNHRRVYGCDEGEEDTDREETPKNQNQMQNEEAHSSRATSTSNCQNSQRGGHASSSRSSLPANTSHVLAIGRRPSPVVASVNRPPIDDSNPLGWQAGKASLKERLAYMYCNEILADVYFSVGKDDDRQRIPAHQFVLSIGSVVFDAMFNGGLTPNKSSTQPLEIELPDVEPAAFLTLLKFLYTDEVNIGPESVMTTLYTAKKYAVPAMETACVDFLKQSLGADNAFMLLTQARMFDEHQLADLCLEIIDKNTIEALYGEGFTEIDLDTLCAVLSRDTLRVKEAPLFQAVVGWAKEECSRRSLEPTTENQRSVLGKALQLIRFPLMSVEEFAQTAAQSGLLSDRELVSLFLHFTINPKPVTSFVDRPRCGVASKERVVNRFQRIEVRWGYSGTPDRIKFTVDRKIYVVGFGLHGSIHGPYEYQVTIQMIHCGTGKVLAQNDTSFVCDGSPGTFRVLFREPVEVLPSVTYIASACLRGPDSHYGTKGLRRIVHQAGGGETVTFQFTYAAGNNNGTSVEDGQIPEIIFFTNRA